VDILHAVILGIVEGVTEYLPVSSTGHLTVVEKLLGYKLDDPGITAFTAIVQIGAIAAALLYFRKDIFRVALAWLAGLFDKTKRTRDYWFGWAIIAGSMPIAVVGLLGKDIIETSLRSLWWVVAGLVVWSVVMWWADKYSAKLQKSHRRGEDKVTIKDTVIIGAVQCIALIPGVSRSGATISAGLLRNIDRVAATRLSFFLGIPALVAAGGLQAVSHAKNIDATVGWTPTIVGIVVSFLVGYVSIAWLLKYVARHDFGWFISYRLALAGVIAALILTGTIGAV